MSSHLCLLPLPDGKKFHPNLQETAKKPSPQSHPGSPNGNETKGRINIIHALFDQRGVLIFIDA
jgi:hypothetical protein